MKGKTAQQQKHRWGEKTGFVFEAINSLYEEPENVGVVM